MNNNTFKEYIQKMYYDIIFKRIKSFIISNRFKIRTYSHIVPNPTFFELDDFHIKSVTFLNSDGDRQLIFNSSIQADIIIKGKNNGHYEVDRVHQWFSVSFSGILNNGLNCLHITDVNFYSKEKYQLEDVLSKYLVPYIKSNTLDEEAHRFLEKYYPESLNHPMAIPVVEIVKKMNLEIYLSPLPANIFGQIFFNEQDVKIYDDYGNLVNKRINGGTILVNKDVAFISSVGTLNNTIVHECVHWFLHHRYFELQKIINPKYNYLSCKVIEDYKLTENPKEEEIAWMEWQANSIAPKILIPYSTGKQKFEEIFYSIENETTQDRAAMIMEKAILEFAEFFNVSLTSAKIRAIELGFTKAIGTFNFVDGKRIPPFSFNNLEIAKNQTFLIDTRNVLLLSAICPALKDDLANGRFIHAQGFLVINDPKYVIIEDGKETKLTNYALDHVDECCYLFTRKTKVSKHYDDSYYRICYLCRDIDSKSFIEATFDPKEGNNENVQKESIELAKIHKEMDRVIGIVNNLPNSFCGTLDAHIKRKKYTNEDVAGYTMMNEKTIREYRNNLNANPSIKSVMALCIGLNLHPKFAFDLIRKAGYDITSRSTEEYVTYCYLINNLHMESIEKWNKVLKFFGSKPLP